MKCIPKPDLAPARTPWEKPGLISKALMSRLLVEMRKAKRPKFTKEAEALFLDRCNLAMQLADDEKVQIANADEQDQLRDIATAARELLRVIKLKNQQARDTFEKHSDTLAAVQKPVVRLPARVIAAMRASGRNNTLLSLTWDYVQATEQAAIYAAERVNPSRGNRAGDANALHLATMIVDAHLDVLEALPPSNKSSWFAEFVRVIGDDIGLSCGPSIVEKAVKSKRNSPVS